MGKERAKALPARRKASLPDEVRLRLERVEAAAREALEGTGSNMALDNSLRALRMSVDYASWEHRQERRHQEPPEVVDFTSAVAANLKRWRTERADWTQASVADAMQQCGVPWTRVTVAEVESGARKVSLEELLILASLYSVPMTELLMFDAHQALQHPDGRVIEGGIVNDMITGLLSREQVRVWAKQESTDDIPFQPMWNQTLSAACYIAGSTPDELDWRPAKDVALRHMGSDASAKERLEAWRRQREAREAARPARHYSVLLSDAMSTEEEPAVTIEDDGTLTFAEGVYVDQQGRVVDSRTED